MFIKIKKNYYISCFFYPFIFICFFSLVYIIAILLLTYDMVTDLEYFIFTAFTLKFGVKSLLSEGGDTGRGYM